LLSRPFEVVPSGVIQVALRQDPVLLAPLHRGDPGRSSLLCESDLVLTKTTTDIVVNGVAHAPEGRAVDSTMVTVRVGPVAKQLRVFGERHWRNGKPSRAESFVQMPIVYERAFGGCDTQAKSEGAWDARNPVGTGFVIERGHLDATPPPNIEYPGELIQSWRDRPRPAGLGPIEGHWQPRAVWAGTYDDRWTSARLPLPPDDFDDRYFQCVPADQLAPAFLTGGEPVILRGLLADGDLTFDLPRCPPSFESRFFKGPPQRHAGLLHTVLLQPPRFSLVFHSALPCHERGDWLERTVISSDWNSLAPHLPADRADVTAKESA
jgi:hypothetical protein